ncbi:MAG: Acryloyl-CoA reductase (NADH) [Steroidobacteraceae bacterium]|nr:Acryloyl-CoA reductase (NADH) [Steroidobacteraceae bacterium]
MDIHLSDEQQMLVDSAREFLRDHCPLATVRQWEKLPHRYPPELWRQIAGMGWAGIVYPEAHGGMGLGNLDMALLMREMGRVALPSPILPTVLLAGRCILEAGSDEQKAKLLPRIIAGELLMSFAFMEASAQPDAATVRTTAASAQGGYVLNGTKHFVEYAEQSELMLVVARSGAGAAAEQGLTLFLVDAKAPGIRYESLETLALQPQARVVLENVRVAAADVIGRVGEAWPVLDRVIQAATAILCGYLSGIAEGAHELGVSYSKERVQYGQPIGAFQAIQNYLATTWAKNVMGEYLGYYAAWLIDQGIPGREAVSTAKAFVGYSAVESTQLATQLHGGLGATVDARTTPFLRWAKQLQQTLGNCQYHEKVIAAEILDKDPPRLDEKFSIGLT